MSNTSHINKKTVAACILLLLTLSGCTTMDWSKGLDLDLPWSKHDKPQIPTRMVAMWTDTVMQQSGKRGVRGFGGRLMFYAKGKEQPVKVDGGMTIFAFAAGGLDPTTTVPEKKYVFLPGQLQKYYSESELGHSYSIWLPWDEVGGRRREINLVVKFESKEGASILSKPSLQRLPGMEPQPTAVASQTKALKPGGVRQVSHEEPAGPTRKLRILTTDTIDVPPGFLGSSRAKAINTGPAGVALIAPGLPVGPELPSSGSQPWRSPARTSTQSRPIRGRVTMPPFRIRQRYRPEPLPPPGLPNASAGNPSDDAASPLGLPAVIAD